MLPQCLRGRKSLGALALASALALLACSSKSSPGFLDVPAGDGGAGDGALAEAGADVQLPSTCDGAGCAQTLANARAIALAADGKDVYFASLEDGGGALARVPAGGGAVTTLATPPEAPLGLLVAGAELFWVSYGARGNLLRIPAAGGTPSLAASDPLAITLLAHDASSLFFVATAPGSAQAGAGLKKVPLAGGTPSTLVTLETPVASAALDPSLATLYWGYAVAGTSHARIVKAPTTGGAPVIVAELPDDLTLRKIVVDASAVYWAVSNPATGAAAGGSVWKQGLAGGSATKLTEWTTAVPLDLALEGDHLYVASFDGAAAGDIRRITIASGTVDTLADRPATSLAVDSTSLYAASDRTGSILKLAK